MALTEAQVIQKWNDRWAKGFRPYAEAIEKAAATCDAKAGKEKMACYAVAVASRKVQEKTAEGIIRKGVSK